MRSDITAEFLREHFHYEVVTGRLYRLKPMGSTGKVGLVRGTDDGNGHIQITVRRRVIKMHRVVFLWVEGRWPTGDTDHVNQVKNCNAWHNLREVTRAQNMFNTRAHVDGKSGVKGVTPRGDRWISQVTINGRNTYLGIFDTLTEAAEVVRQARERHHGEFVSH